MRSDLPLRLHVIGTALLSALVSSGSISFDRAVDSALKFGTRWDESLRSQVNAETEDEIGWARFEQVSRTDGRPFFTVARCREARPACAGSPGTSVLVLAHG